ncbi:MAG: TatD family hydrolase [Planctomycetes bacterium]|nr:TatD family hydrolase [Planctomycetota bacterium]
MPDTLPAPPDPDAVLIDSHAHLDFRPFDEDRDTVLEHAAAAGVAGIVNPGVDVASSRRALALAAAHPGVVRAAAGIHPMGSGGNVADALAALGDLADDPRVVAVGETGLDLFKKYHPLAEQRACFAGQLRLAAERRLPVIIHCREAFAETLAAVRAEGFSQLRGVLHCFSGRWQDAVGFLELGMHVGFAANLTYPRAAALREAAVRIPLDRLLVETDAPYLPPQKLRGQRNEPAFVRAAAVLLAALRRAPAAEIARATTRNALALFGGRPTPGATEAAEPGS